MLVEDRLSDVLSEFARTLATDFPIQGILDHLVHRIVDVLPIDAAGVTLISGTTEPRFIAASDDSAMRFERLQTDLADEPCLAAYTTNAAVSIPDLAEDPHIPRFAERALDEGLVAVFAFPLRDGDRGLGALDLYRETAGPLSDSEMAAAQTLADVATAYLLNAQARVDRNIERLTTLANDLLTLARLEQGAVLSENSDVDLRDVVLAAGSALQALIDSRSLDVTFEVPPHPGDGRRRCPTPRAPGVQPADQRRAVHRGRRLGPLHAVQRRWPGAARGQ